MNWLRYLSYVSLIPALIALIQQAQAAFQGAGSGAEKFKSVQQAFTALVTMLMSFGLLSSRLGTRLISVSGALIELVLDVLKDSNNGEVPLPAPLDPPVNVASYGKTMRYTDTSPIPDDAALKAQGYASGDRVAHFTTNRRTYWFVAKPEGPLTNDLNFGAAEAIRIIA